jgi:hypothetical protein|tara:strand:+ start:1013 stop:1309 length:297 start_codon:yes stop_codon:yes gene_type:complete
MNNKLYTDPTYQRFKKYKKKYSLGNNFDLNLKESNSEVYLKDKVNWERARTEFKLSKKQMLELIDKGEVFHTWQDSINKDMSYKGTVTFKDREPKQEK